MRKAIVALIVIIILVAGGILIFHKSPKPAANNNSTGSTSQTATNPAVNNSIVLTKSNSSLGQYLTDPSGKPLYTYNADTSGVSNCNGSCLTIWPAYAATASMANLPTGISTITRTDTHQVQYTYNGLPLYYFVSDTASGQPTGNGVQNFSIAKPAASTSSSSSTNSSSSSNSSSGYPY